MKIGLGFQVPIQRRCRCTSVVLLFRFLAMSTSRQHAPRRDDPRGHPPEEAYQRVVGLLRQALRVPLALVSLLEEERQVFNGSAGLPGYSVGEREMPLCHSLCRHVVEEGEPWSGEDIRTHPTMSDHPAVRDLGVVALAGVPIRGRTGEVLGALCAMDYVPRAWGPQELEMLEVLAAQVATEFDLRLALQVQQETRAHYEQLVEGARDHAIFWLTPEGRVASWNLGAERIMGYREAEALGLPLEVFYPEEERTRGIPGQVLAEAYKTGVTRRRGWRLRRDGSRFWAEVTLSALYDAEGQLTGYSKITSDRTEQHEAEQRREESERRFRVLIEEASDVVSILDPTGRRRYVSPAVEKLLGVPASELIGTSAFAQLHREDRPRAEALFAELLARPGAQRRGRMRMRHVDGHYVHLDVLATNRLNDPAVGGIIVNTHDVSETEQAEARYRAMFEATVLGMVRTSAPFEVLETNPAIRRMLGLGLKITFEDIRRVTYPEDRDLDEALLEQLLAGTRDHYRLEKRYLAPDGRVLWGVLHVHMIRNDQGAVQTLFAMVEDVTARREMEEQLRQASKMEAVGRLAGGVAHDFNNMLLAITGFAALLEAEIGPEGAAAEYLLEIQKAADRSAKLTRQLLAFGRKQMLRVSAVSINDLLAGMEGLLERVIGKDVQVLLDTVPGVPVVQADAGQLEQVVLNLAINARDAMPGGGVLTLRTRIRELNQSQARRGFVLSAGRYVVLEVGDTGTGMDAVTLEQIFEPFFTTKEAGRGTGLGLATVYGIVEQSGGHIEVESVLGGGSIFRIFLPASRTAHSGPSSVAKGAGPMAAGLGVTVLVVEDEDAVRSFIRRMLERAGYAVLEAANGRKALEQAGPHAGDIDLVLTDVGMPEMGGYDLARQLRARKPDIRVVFMSGYADDSVERHGALGSCVPLLQKPFELDELLRVLQQLLQNEKPA